MKDLFSLQNIILVPTELVQISPSSVLIDDRPHQIQRTAFEIDQVRGQAILNKTPAASSDRVLTGFSRRLSLQDQDAFRETGNNALVSTTT